MAWTPLLGLAVAFVPLLLLGRWVHRHLQNIAVLVAGDLEVAVLLYSLPLFPGILLHELSHTLAARGLGVHVGRMSLRPKVKAGRVQLGSVPVGEADKVRASLIGLAPLVAGSAAILLIGYGVFGIGDLESAILGGDWATALEGLRGVLGTADCWVWLYLVFAVSNTMLPSRADRHAWTPVLIFLGIAAGLVWAAGLAPTLLEALGQPLEAALRWLATMCGFTVLADLPFLASIAGVEALLTRWRRG
jgi:hypothetical protein